MEGRPRVPGATNTGTGDSSVTTTTTPGPRMAAVIEDAEFLASVGVDDADAAPRLGYKDRLSLERALHRAGRYDVVSRLRANAVDR